MATALSSASSSSSSSAIPAQPRAPAVQPKTEVFDAMMEFIDFAFGPAAIAEDGALTAWKLLQQMPNGDKRPGLISIKEQFNLDLLHEWSHADPDAIGTEIFMEIG